MVFLIPIAALFGVSAVTLLADETFWLFGLLLCFVPLACVGYVFWAPKSFALDGDGVTVGYAFGRTRRYSYRELIEVRLRGKDSVFFRPKGRLLHGFRESEYEGDFGAAAKCLLVAAREHDVAIRVDPRGAIGLPTKAQRARDLEAWEVQLGIRPQLPRAIVKKKEER